MNRKHFCSCSGVDSSAVVVAVLTAVDVSAVAACGWCSFSCGCCSIAPSAACAATPESFVARDAAPSDSYAPPAPVSCAPDLSAAFESAVCGSAASIGSGSTSFCRVGRGVLKIERGDPQQRDFRVSQHVATGV